jgi:hypothetical protein
MTYVLVGLGIYFLYIILTLSFIFSQKKINSFAWYLKVYKRYISSPTGNLPKNKLELARGISILPIAFLFQEILSWLAFGVAILLILIFDWLLIPFFSGKIPKIRFSEYFQILKIFEPEKEKKVVFYFPSILLLLLSFLIVVLGRFFDSSAVPAVDAVIVFFIFLGVSILSTSHNSNRTPFFRYLQKA